MFNYFLKTIILGNSWVGKSTILTGYSQKAEPTIGIDLITQNVLWNHNTTKMHIWDTSGNINYFNILKTYLSSCIGAFVVCNLNNTESVNSLENWIRLYLDYRKSYSSIIIVGNIFEYNYNINYEKMNELCKKYNAYYIEVDAKKSGMTSAIYKKMVEIILEDYKLNPNLFRNIEGFRDELKIKHNGDYSVEIGENIEENNKDCCSYSDCSIM
jgi:small GTP-binding protein